MSEREAALPPRLSSAEPAPLWRRLPPINRKRLLWLMSQLAQSTAAEEPSDESE